MVVLKNQDKENQLFANKTYDLLRAIVKFDKSQYSNIMPIVSVLDKITIAAGFAIGMFQIRQQLQLNYKIYVFFQNPMTEFIPKFEHHHLITHKKFLHLFNVRVNRPTLVLSKNSYCPGMHITGIQQDEIRQMLPSIYDFIHVEWTKEGIWQLYLFQHLQEFLNRLWKGAHGRYGIVSQRQIQVIKELFPLAPLDNLQLLPNVSITDDNSATIESCYLNYNDQLCKETMIFKRINHVVKPFSVKQEILFKNPSRQK